MLHAMLLDRGHYWMIDSEKGESLSKASPVWSLYLDCGHDQREEVVDMLESPTEVICQACEAVAERHGFRRVEP